MERFKGKLYIGTSGYIYPHWTGVFYPQKLSSQEKLRYYSRYFKTVEINYSFYHLPQPSTYKNWYSNTPKDFLFAIKASRFITHIKRLKGVKIAWRSFIGNALILKDKLGPVLMQFPPSFQATEENIKRLKKFFQFLDKSNRKIKLAIEFRHKTWCQEKIYKLLREHNIAWVIADSSRFPKAEQVTAKFVYVRMHGGEALYSSDYSSKELKQWAEKIKKWLHRGLNVFVYFNNDASGYAIKNAQELLNFIFSEREV